MTDNQLIFQIQSNNRFRVFCKLQMWRLLTKISFLSRTVSTKSLRLPSYSHFPLNSKIYQFLQQKQIHTPTYIQYAFLTELQNKQNPPNFHLVSPTGSGKTLAYMIPLIDSLKKQQQTAGAILTKSQRPRALIIVPSKQLILQARQVGKSIGHHCKIRCEGINIGRSLLEQRKILQQGVDILISTQQRALSMMDNDRMYLSCIRWLVIDQSDTFNDCQSLGSIFNRIVTPILKRSRQAETLAQNQVRDIFPKSIFVSTTNPPSLSEFIQTNVKKYKLIEDKQTHHNLQNIKHQFHHCNQLDKHQPILKILKQNKEVKILVFCNSVKSLHDLEYYLNSCGIQTLTLHSHLSKEMRLRNYQHFRDSVQRLMLTTDLGSRGLDFPDLQLVINYDFPVQLSDYLHRVGRTGRAGKRGQAITLYHKKNLPMIEQLRGSSFNQPLNVSNSAYGLKNRTLKPMQSKLRMRKRKN